MRATSTRISWDEALDEISRRFKKISDDFGPEAILPYSYAGNMGVLSYSGMAHRFFYRLGASQLDRTICASAGGAGLVSVIGRSVGTGATDNFAIPNTSLPGARIFMPPTSTCGRLLKKRGATAPSWW